MRCWCGDSAFPLCCLSVCSDTVGRVDLDQTRDRRQQVVFSRFTHWAAAGIRATPLKDEREKRLLLLMDKVSQPCNLWPFVPLIFLTFRCNYIKPPSQTQVSIWNWSRWVEQMSKVSQYIFWLEYQLTNCQSPACPSPNSQRGQPKDRWSALGVFPSSCAVDLVIPTIVHVFSLTSSEKQPFVRTHYNKAAVSSFCSYFF